MGVTRFVICYAVGMAINIKVEKLIPVGKLPTHLKTMGQPIVSTATLHRWISNGLKGVKLEHVQMGRIRCTTVAALQRFFGDLAELDKPGDYVSKNDRSGRRLQTIRAAVVLA